jgi:hypothetical protein
MMELSAIAVAVTQGCCYCGGGKKGCCSCGGGDKG